MPTRGTERDPWQLMFRLFGATLIIIALIWLKPYGGDKGLIGKALLVGAAVVYSFVPQPPIKKVRSFKMMPEWRSGRSWMISGIAAALTVAGLRLTLPTNVPWWQLLHFCAGLVGLVYGVKLLLAIPKPMQVGADNGSAENGEPKQS